MTLYEITIQDLREEHEAKESWVQRYLIRGWEPEDIEWITGWWLD